LHAHPSDAYVLPSNALGLLTGLGCHLQIVAAGFRWLCTGGHAQQYNAARKQQLLLVSLLQDLQRR
jgi:hypothetical protein